VSIVPVKALRLFVAAFLISSLLTTTASAGGSFNTPGVSQRPTVIIDAGHGGADGGASSSSGLLESTVNLDIAKRLELVLAFFGTKVVMTRTEETLEYSEKATTIRAKKAEDQKRRLNLINGTPNAVLISIHQNTYPSASPFGAQVLYAPTDGSKELGESMQQLLIAALNPANRRTAAKIPDSILLMNNIKCPAVLIECGFLSNASEEQLLRTDNYRLKLAVVIGAGILYNRDNLANRQSGGTNEGENRLLLHRLR
jgi:N-acetylmuramoyl-L-alanine amidase